MKLTSEEFKAFQTLLVEKSGLFFQPDRQDVLESALHKRLKEQSLDTFAGYYELLTGYNDQDELQELVDLLTIGETYFFRNHFQFEAFQNTVLPELTKRKRNINLWSAGCATGEEAYTLAMLILESVPDIDGREVIIIATDINQHFLQKAKHGVYSERAVNRVPKYYLEKYFKKVDRKYYLSDEVKKRVTFVHHNLAADPFTAKGMQEADVIFCRNVIIYFDLPTIKNVIDKFYRALADDGYLFLGFSETLWQIDERFGLVEFPHTFIYKKGIVPEKEISHPFVDIPEFVFEPAPGTVVEITETPLLPPVEREDVAPYIKKALELANAADYEGALSELKKIIGIDNLCLECYYLMGVLLEKTGRLDAAIAEYRRAVYIEPDLSIAYYNLGNIYAFQKKINEAKKAFQNAIKILKSQPADELVHFSDSVSCGLLLTACEKRLEI